MVLVINLFIKSTPFCLSRKTKKTFFNCLLSPDASPPLSFSVCADSNPSSSLALEKHEIIGNKIQSYEHLLINKI